MRISRDFVRPVPVTMILELPGRSSPGDFRQKGGKLIGRYATDGKPFRQLSSPEPFSPAIASTVRRHCLYHRFKAFRRPSPRSSLIGLKPSRLKATLSALARPRFLPLRNISEVTLEFIVTGGKTAYLRVKDVVVFPSTWMQSSFYDCKWK